MHDKRLQNDRQFLRFSGHPDLTNQERHRCQDPHRLSHADRVRARMLLTSACPLLRREFPRKDDANLLAAQRGR